MDDAPIIGERDVVERTCDGCGRSFDRARGFVYRGGDPYAVYLADCHGHPEHEVWIDVVLGSWAEGDDAQRVTFSCRVTAAGASAVDAPVVASRSSAIVGAALSRDAALAHPWLARFWEVVDLAVVEDPSVGAEIAASA